MPGLNRASGAYLAAAVPDAECPPVLGFAQSQACFYLGVAKGVSTCRIFLLDNLVKFSYQS